MSEKILDKREYILRAKDTPIVSFTLACIASQIQGINRLFHHFQILSVEIKAQDTKLLPKRLQYYMKASPCLEDAVAKWLDKRKASDKRPNALAFLNCAGDRNNHWRYIESNYAMSLNDTFWISPADAKIKWEDISPYRQLLDKDLADMAFAVCFDWNSFNNSITARISAEPTTQGVLRKCWINYNNSILLRKGDWFDTRYRNADGRNTVVMEYYAAQVAEVMGLPHVPYNLNIVRHTNGYEEVVCECPLFTSEDIGFVSAADVLRDPDSNIDGRLLQLMDGPYLHNVYSLLFGEQFYKDMKLFDFIIMNTDRHLGNFGLLVNNNTGDYIGPAPLFDSGNSVLVELRQDLDHTGLYTDSDMTYCMEHNIYLFSLIEERHISILNKLTEFEFKPHPLGIGIEESSLSKMSRIIRERCRFAIKFWEYNRSLESL